MAPGPRPTSCAFRSNGCENVPQTTIGGRARGPVFGPRIVRSGASGFSHAFIGGK